MMRGNGGMFFLGEVVQIKAKRQFCRFVVGVFKQSPTTKKWQK
jgi:hypothetical protein